MATDCENINFNNNPKTITWERLEAHRLKKLGLSNKYSRHFNVLRSSKEMRPPTSYPAFPSGEGQRENPFSAMQRSQTMVAPGQLPDASKKVNSLAPFATLGKATCGVFFTRETDNKKKKFGIPPSDLVKWRNITGPSTQ